MISTTIGMIWFGAKAAAIFTPNTTTRNFYDRKTWPKWEIAWLSITKKILFCKKGADFQSGRDSSSLVVTRNKYIKSGEPLHLIQCSVLRIPVSSGRPQKHKEAQKLHRSCGGAERPPRLSQKMRGWVPRGYCLLAFPFPPEMCTRNHIATWTELWGAPESPDRWECSVSVSCSFLPPYLPYSREGTGTQMVCQPTSRPQAHDGS